MDGAQCGERIGEAQKFGPRPGLGSQGRGSDHRAELGLCPLRILGPSFPRLGTCRQRIWGRFTREAKWEGKGWVLRCCGSGAPELCYKKRRLDWVKSEGGETVRERTLF